PPRQLHPFPTRRSSDLAQTLQGACTRAGDVVARYGGEEFAALLPDTAAAAALELAEQARARVEARGIVHPASDCARVVTVSVGVDRKSTRLNSSHVKIS